LSSSTPFSSGWTRKRLSTAKAPSRPFLLLLALLLSFTTQLVTAQPPPGELGPPPAVAAGLPAAPLTAGDEAVFLPALFDSEFSPTCALSAEEAAIAALMRDHPLQQRPSLSCHRTLAQVARARAEDMRDRAYFSHTNPDGYGPNYLVTAAGYVLPAYYNSAPDANNIESIAAGYPTPAAAWEAWMNSPPHRAHLLGEIDFFARQIEYGIGYARGGPYGDYWVVIAAEPGP
jgi:hypothetical protein